MLEIGAAREAIRDGVVEPVETIPKPLDVLAQHLMSWALSGGFGRDEALTEVRQAPPYSDLSEQEFDWVMALLVRGGECLQAYPDYHRLVNQDGRWSQRISVLHAATA